MMIEVFNKARVAALLVFLILVFTATLLLKSHWAYTRQLALQESIIQSKARKAAPCEQYTTLLHCQRCPKQELHDLVTYCMETGYKEKIRCPDGKEVFTWCDISPAVEEQDFWKFQLCTLLFGLSSYAVVFLRQRNLDKKLMEKINKQIAAGV